MTKKHFIRAAEIVRDIEDRQRALNVASYFLVLFREFNERFDTARFLKACNLESVY